MGVKKAAQISIEQYLEHEYNTPLKHEYEKGAILAMTEGSINHGILCGNVYSELRAGLTLAGEEGCSALGSEIRIHIEEADAIVYPDAMVICGGIETSADDQEAVTNPRLVVEVLSDSTESYDRGDKFHKYRQLDTLEEYVLVAQDKPVVETYYRKEANVWEIARFVGKAQQLQLKSIGLTLALEALYTDVQLPGPKSE